MGVKCFPLLVRANIYPMNELFIAVQSSVDIPSVLCDLIESYARYKFIPISEIKSRHWWFAAIHYLACDDFCKEIIVIKGQPSITADEISKYFDQVSQIYLFNSKIAALGSYIQSCLLVKLYNGIYLYIQHDHAHRVCDIYLRIYASRSLNDLLNASTLRSTLSDLDCLSQLQ